MSIRLTIYLCLLFLSGCVTYSAVGPGHLKFPGLMVETGSSWNQVPKEALKLSRPDSKTWTQDGILLDRIIIIPGVPEGEPIFRQLAQSQALPVFQANMFPNEIEELTESSIVKLFGEGRGAVETANLRPQLFGQSRGMLFDIQITLSDGPNYRGIAGAIIAEEKLNLILYFAAEPYYFEKHADEALEIIKSARVISSI